MPQIFATNIRTKKTSMNVMNELIVSNALVSELVDE